MGRFLQADNPFGKGGFFGGSPPPPAAPALQWVRLAGAAQGLLAGELVTDVASINDPDSDQTALACTNQGRIFFYDGFGWAGRAILPAPITSANMLASDEAGTVVVLGYEIDGVTPHLAVSTDSGATWTDTTPASYFGTAIYYLPRLGVFFTLSPPSGLGNGTAYTSPDGTVWTGQDLGVKFSPFLQYGSGVSPAKFTGCVLDDGTDLYIAGTNASASPNDGIILKSPDALAWSTAFEPGALLSAVFAVARTATLYFADPGGQGASAGHHYVYTSPDGAAWSLAGDSTDIHVPPFQGPLVTFGAWCLNASSVVDGAIARSTDGVAWSAIAPTAAVMTTLGGMIAGIDVNNDPRAYCCGTGDPSAIVSSTDGITWSADTVHAGDDQAQVNMVRVLGTSVPNVWAVGAGADGFGGIWLQELV